MHIKKWHAVLVVRAPATPIWKGRGCSSEILNLAPKRDQSGRGQSYGEGNYDLDVCVSPEYIQYLSPHMECF